MLQKNSCPDCAEVFSRLSLKRRWLVRLNMGLPSTMKFVVSIVSLILASCTPTNIANYDADGCMTAQTIDVTPAGTTSTYKNWSIKILPGAVTTSAKLIVKDCPAVNIQHQVLIGARDKKTGETETESVPLKTEPGYEPVKLVIDGSNADASKFLVCPQSNGKRKVSDLLLTVRFNGIDKWATPDLTNPPESKCYQPFKSEDTVVSTVILSAADSTWDTVWKALSSIESKLFDKINQGLSIALDSCAACSYVGFKIGDKISCGGLVNDTICDTISTIGGAFAPILIVPGIKQVFCFAGNKLIDLLSKTFSGQTPKEACEDFIRSGSVEFKDVVTCEFHYACHYVSLCTSAENDRAKDCKSYPSEKACTVNSCYWDNKLGCQTFVESIKGNCEEACSNTSLDSSCCTDNNDDTCFGKPIPVNCQLIVDKANCDEVESCTWNGSACSPKA